MKSKLDYTILALQLQQDNHPARADAARARDGRAISALKLLQAFVHDMRAEDGYVSPTRVAAFLQDVYFWECGNQRRPTARQMKVQDWDDLIDRSPMGGKNHGPVDGSEDVRDPAKAEHCAELSALLSGPLSEFAEGGL